MKIKKDSYLYLYLMDRPDEIKNVIERHAEEGFDDPAAKRIKRNSMREMLSREGWHDYLITEAALEEIERIDLSRLDTLHFMSDLPDKSYTFFIRDQFIRFTILEDSMRVLHLRLRPHKDTTMFTWGLFEVELEDMSIHGADLPFPEPGEEGYDHSQRVLENYRNSVETLKACVLYIFYSDTTYRFIAGNSKTGKTRAEKVINTSPRGFELVTKNWNTITVRGKDIQVDPFYRMQPYGPGRSKRKPIMVKGHVRKGRKIKARKD